MAPSLNSSTDTQTSVQSSLPAAPTSTPVVSRDLLGVRFHCLRLEEVLQWIHDSIAHRIPRQICLANAYTLMLCHQDERLRRLINTADLTLADGMSIVWGARWLGLRIPGRIAGPDLMEALCAQATANKYSIYLLGSTPENLRQLSQALRSRWPNLELAGTHSPSICDRLDESETNAILEEVNRANPDILFVGMSAPKQEIWIAENLKRLQVPVCIGVGAAFDFLSGRIPRAPKYLRESGLEWLYRLYCEPRRLWRRYLLGNAVYLSLILSKFLQQRFHSRRAQGPSS